MGQIPPHELSRLEAIAGPSRPLEELVARRLGGEPLQYIEGSAAFGTLDLIVDERVLVPRPETEGLFEIANRMVRNPEVVVDLCTGSGALALALKNAFPSAAVFATDISEAAIEVATENKARTGLEIYLAVGELYDPLPASLLGEVDLLVANPPYVSEAGFATLPADVKREPRVALVAGPTGLEVIEEIGDSAAMWLRPGGVLVCEIGERQGVSASSSFRHLPTVVRQDWSGRDRYVVAVKP
ncbi:MAG TPA: peptide chain release factor N(5)-glutamine methyltransferase [Acidimicrobiia bacterium]|nr:peptide chain release factor N(5)-glutamine methyltransferase [Acidimicrobiia bacterium]